MSNRILVVTSCTGEKLHKPDNQLVLDDFKYIEKLVKRERELAAYQERADKMYTGSQHLALMKGITEYRQHGGEIDLCIISAGYGLLNEDARIVPYEVTFNTMDGQSIKKWSRQLEITQKLQEKVADYDLIFFLLGDKYLQAVEWPLNLVNNDQRAIFFAGGSSRSRILNWNNYHVLTIGEREAKEFKFGLIGIKGYLFSHLLKRISEGNIDSTWNIIKNNPEQSRELILESLSSTKQPELFSETSNKSGLLRFYNEMFPVPDKLVAINCIEEPKFFLPENDDRVDPNYDFFKDFSEKDRNPLENDVYAHQIFNQPQFDGLLVSKVNIDNATKQKSALMKEMGMHDFYKLPREYPILGDCGAFSYIDKEVPPYTTQEIIDYYHNLGFDYGVSIDHLVIGAFQRDEAIRNQRYDLTLTMAEEFIRLYRENKDAMGYRFHPIGIVQGWDPPSFRRAVEHLIELGYDYVALGGLAREQSEKIYEILKEIAPIIPSPTFRMHLFGVARDIKTMESFHKLGVTSFDSSSPLRRAWLGTGHNYHTLSGKHYTAIRIPEAKETSGRVKKMLALNNEIEFSEYKRLEQEALSALREFGAGKRELSSTLDAILEYDKILGENREMHEDLYMELLSERPWEQCQCNICREIGIDVVVFRGNNRNRRRGFHNTHVYFSQIQEYKKQWNR
ncbi:tRNA-guanine transglycosylase DpdA [Paenibacillus sp. FSL H7-0716]|uniref:Queuine/other tRNA-ribosyltransferase n=1 Tax=Paenibacillus odorifer TaxID=189426 RepID=A0AB36JAL9_9BACL|nr:tRNA-guanine transglycosylase DpdA [Paenibacillus odorifer]OME16564.1 queuine/other tRNA-ribosyltransferase [Paenibacillus odorifer]